MRRRSTRENKSQHRREFSKTLIHVKAVRERLDYCGELLPQSHAHDVVEIQIEKAFSKTAVARLTSSGSTQGSVMASWELSRARTGSFRQEDDPCRFWKM
jgi:hypothetical protein